MTTYTYKQPELSDSLCINTLLKCIFALLKNYELITGEHNHAVIKQDVEEDGSFCCGMV